MRVFSDSTHNLLEIGNYREFFFIGIEQLSVNSSYYISYWQLEKKIRYDA